MWIRTTLVSLMLVLSVASVQARRVTALLTPDRVTLKRTDGQPSSQDQVRKAILNGSLPFGWVLVADKPGSLDLSYTKQGGGHMAVVRIDYDAQSYQINYVSSVNLNYEPGQIHPTYNGWVRNLTTRIMLPGELMPPSAVAMSAKPAASD